MDGERKTEEKRKTNSAYRLIDREGVHGRDVDLMEMNCFTQAVDRPEPYITPLKTLYSLTSIAISLRRIADELAIARLSAQPPTKEEP